MADHNIEINVKLNNERVVSELKGLRDDLKEIQKMNNLNISLRANFGNVLSSLGEIRNDLRDIAAAKLAIDTGNIDQVLDTMAYGFDAVIEAIQKINGQEIDVKSDNSGVNETVSAVERLANGFQIAADAASVLSSVMGGLGNFADLFGGAFEGMTSLVGGDILKQVGNTLISEATKTVTSNLGNIVSRYDIMNTFADYMELAGVSNTVANESLAAVDQSIRGIPIGLDEAAFRLRKYQMYMGDIEKATQFTIGIQKAITAGGASESMKNTAYTQIDRLLATGKLGQSRQWLSLFNGLGVSLKFLKEELALDPTADLKTVAADLASGAIATEDFIDAIARLADNEGLDRALEIYKGTTEAWIANIQNAVKRGGQHILEEANASMEEVLGFGITGAMKKIRDQIDITSASAGDYIRNNPKNTKILGDSITGLIDRVMSLDGGRFLNNVVSNTGKILDTVSKVFDSIPKGAIEDFTSFAMTWAGPMSMLFKVTQSGLPIVLGVFERLEKMDMGSVVEKISREIERFAKVISGLLDVIPDGLLGDLMAMGLVWGKPLMQLFNGLASAFSTISGALRSVKDGGGDGGLLSTLIKIASTHPELAAVAAAVLAISAGIGAAYSSYKEWKRGVIEDSGLGEIERAVSNIEYETGRAKESLEGSTDQFKADMELIRINAEESKKLLDLVLETDEKIRNATTSDEHADLYAQQIENIEKLKELQPGLLLELDTAGRLANAAALREQGDAYIEYVQKMAEAEAAASIIEEAGVTAANARVNEIKLRNRRKETRKIIEDAESIINQSYGKSALWWVPEENRMTGYEAERVAEAEVTKNNALKDLEEINLQIGENVLIQKDAQETMDAANGIMESATASARGLAKGYDEVSGSAETAEEKTAELSERTQEIKEFYEAARDAAREWIESEMQGFDEMEHVGPSVDENGNPTQTYEEWVNQTISDMTKGTKSQTAEGAAYDNALETIESYIAGLDEGAREKVRPAIEQALEGAWSDRGQVISIAEAIEESMESGDWDGLADLFNEKWEESGITESIAAHKADIAALFQFTDEDLENAANEDNDVFNLVERLKQNVESLGDIDISGFNRSMDDLRESADPAADAMQNVASNAETAKSNISTLATIASQKAGSFDGLTSSMHGVASAAAAAAIETRALATAINSLQDKTVTVSVSMSGNIGRVAGAAASMLGLSGGGLVNYLADGGFPGIGKGTDIIPAWLTPGEYVMKRSAVGLFGSGFMDRINKMDIDGAFDVLMSRISNPMGNTYNRDNHATVNNYFYGDNGQNYSQRKAYKYVGSL